jgi:hypothetical protein
MYPADELGDLYIEDDLPDAVTVNWAGRFTGSMSKSGSVYESGTVSLQVIDDKWTLKDTSTDPESVRVVGRCLITGDGNLTQGDDLVEDQFEDIYFVDASLTDNNFEAGGFPNNTSSNGEEATRYSLCGWSGRGAGDLFDEDGNPYPFWIMNIFFDQETQKWTGEYGVDGDVFDIAYGIFEKSDNQNTPVGTYTIILEKSDVSGLGTRIESGTFTVSEI